jgi:hypothetical protein
MLPGGTHVASSARDTNPGQFSKYVLPRRPEWIRELRLALPSDSPLFLGVNLQAINIPDDVSSGVINEK